MLVAAVAACEDSEWQFSATCLTIVIKFWSAITYFAVNLQSMETYPTCLRQTGISCGVVFSNAVGILGPYIAYLVKFAFVGLDNFKYKLISFAHTTSIHLHPCIQSSHYVYSNHHIYSSEFRIRLDLYFLTSFIALWPLLFDWKCFENQKNASASSAGRFWECEKSSCKGVAPLVWFQDLDERLKFVL